MVKKLMTGVTVNGVQEVCRWDKPSLCPRHNVHVPQGKKFNLTVNKMVDIEADNPFGFSGVSLEDYYNPKVFKTVESLSEEDRMFLNRKLFVEIDGTYYRKNNNGYSLDDFRFVETAEDFTEEEFNTVLDEGSVIIDEVVYFFDEEGFLDSEHKDVDAPYMRLNGWHVETVNMNVPEYVEKYGDEGYVLDYNVEQAYMNGGCAVYALALKELHPEYEIASELFGEKFDPTYNHIFCINPATGEAYDARGRFDSPEALYDYKNDPLTAVNPTNITKSSHEVWNVETLKQFISDGFFNFDDTVEDIDLTKQLIQKFKTRFE